MRNSNSITTWKFSLRALTSLFILFLALFGVFLALAWLLGNTNISEFLTRFQTKGAPTQLIINVNPYDATITLNDQLYNSKDLLIPGEYTVKVEREGFYPMEEIFQIYANQENHLSIQLMPIVATQEIANYATAPGWDEQGKMYFMNGIVDKGI